MKYALALTLCLVAYPASADWWHGDDAGYGTGEGGEPCDCAPGEDGIDWNGDGLSNSDDAAFADPSLYRPGTAWGTRPGNGADPADGEAQDARHKTELKRD